MNKIILKGWLQNINFNHTVGEIEYSKADLIVPRGNGKEDIVPIIFKKYSNKYQENDEIELIGNLRSRSYPVSDNKNKVDIFVFTYFDIPKEENINKVILDGVICKKDEIRTTHDNKTFIHFTLANTIEASKLYFSSYIPCVVWGKSAEEFNNHSVGDKINIEGEFHSRTYKKKLENGEEEFRVAYEVVTHKFEKI